MPVKDIKNQKFGKLLVLERDESKKGGAAYWICKCNCGNIISARGTALRSGEKTSCGCVGKQKRREKMLDTTSLVGKRFGRLTVKERDLTKPIGHSCSSYWICQCDCGNTVSVSFSGLSLGHTQSCGCLHKDQLRERNYKDITNQVFGHLTALENTWELSKHHSYIWKCQCDCGNIVYRSTEDLFGNYDQSCGCIISKGETKIKKILSNNNIPFNTQYTFADLRGINGGLLRFDFAIMNEDNTISRLIEFDGEQHTKINSKYHTSSVVEHDNRKNEYCKQHNIPLARIPYSELKNLSLQLILDDKYLI